MEGEGDEYMNRKSKKQRMCQYTHYYYYYYYYDDDDSTRVTTEDTRKDDGNGCLCLYLNTAEIQRQPMFMMLFPLASSFP